MKTEKQERMTRGKKGQQKNAISCQFVSDYSRLSCRQRKKLRSVIHARYENLHSVTSSKNAIPSRMKLKLNSDIRTEKQAKRIASLDRLSYLDNDGRAIDTLKHALDSNSTWRETGFDRYQQGSKPKQHGHITEHEIFNKTLCRIGNNTFSI